MACTVSYFYLDYCPFSFYLAGALLVSIIQVEISLSLSFSAVSKNGKFGVFTEMKMVELEG